MEYNLTEDKVVHFDVGLTIPKNQPKEAKKPKKTVLIVESSEEDSEAVFSIDNNNVTWENKDYQAIWNKLPQDLKNSLLLDHDWLKDFVINCYKSKQSGKQCEFTSPKNLIIPPQIMDDDEYDFGNETYNNMFNKLDKSYQNTLLSLYNNKDGVRTYKILLDALDNILKKQLGFDRVYL